MELRTSCVRLAFLMFALVCAPSALAQRFITVASTTSTEQSGLFKHLLPVFEQQSGIEVRVVALGTGQALDLARRGDADVVFVHAKSAEEDFLREGHGVRRFPVMYNDFVIIGPKSDPAGISRGTDAPDALRKIKNANAAFVSRGDRSGTHIAEVNLWAAAGIDIAKDKGPWYRETGQGMGPALNTASSIGRPESPIDTVTCRGAVSAVDISSTRVPGSRSAMASAPLRIRFSKTC